MTTTTTTNDPTVTISIGIPNDPTGPGALPADRWVIFCADLCTVARHCTDTDALHFEGAGTGRYRDEAGQLHEERSFTVVFTLSSSVSRDSVRRQLSSLARAYGQECIALTFGATELICPA